MAEGKGQSPAAEVGKGAPPSGSISPLPGSREWFELYKASLESLNDAPPAPSVCDLVTRFNAQELRGAELREFCSHLPECPNCIGAVKLDQLVREALRG